MTDGAEHVTGGRLAMHDGVRVVALYGRRGSVYIPSKLMALWIAANDGRRPAAVVVVVRGRSVALCPCAGIGSDGQAYDVQRNSRAGGGGIVYVPRWAWTRAGYQPTASARLPACVAPVDPGSGPRPALAITVPEVGPPGVGPTA